MAGAWGPGGRDVLSPLCSYGVQTGAHLFLTCSAPCPQPAQSGRCPSFHKEGRLNVTVQVHMHNRTCTEGAPYMGCRFPFLLL